MGDRTFASEYEGVILDMLILDKGLTRRYLPLAITLISEKLSSGIRWVALRGYSASLWS